ncbi:MAG: glycosyltransferase [Leadbetterella sp.]|nr:glycosyltransferase [Leadbetterella sp.]
MIICHILTYSYENGGTSKFVSDLASFQTEKGDEVRILSTELQGHSPYPVPAGVELIPFKPEMVTRVIPLYSSALFDYVEANDKDIDVYHLHCLWNYGEMLVDKLHLHPKTVVTIHGSLHPYTFKGLVYYKRLVYSKWFQKNFLNKVKLIHVNHAGEVKDVADYLGHRPDNLEVIPNGTDIHEVIPTPPDKRNRNELLYIGRLHHKKGFEILMPAFKKIVQTRPDARLLIAGPDDGMLDYIQEFTAQNGLESQVEILGTVTGETKKDLFSKAGIFVLPTYSEGFFPGRAGNPDVRLTGSGFGSDRPFPPPGRLRSGDGGCLKRRRLRGRSAEGHERPGALRTASGKRAPSPGRKAGEDQGVYGI